MKRYRLLDLYCNAGGCSEGYVRAGFMVHGIDIESQPNYPYTFTRCDAIEYAKANGHLYDVIHASPVCKGYTDMQQIRVDKDDVIARHEKQIGELREVLDAVGKPYVIENVVGAKDDLRANLMLCGTMFGLKVIRHRLFEINPLIPSLSMSPYACCHMGSVAGGEYVGVYGNGGAMWADKAKTVRRKGSCRLEDWQDAMDIHWTTKDEITQMIPPAYTEWIGKQLIHHLEQSEVAAELVL